MISQKVTEKESFNIWTGLARVRSRASSYSSFPQWPCGQRSLFTTGPAQGYGTDKYFGSMIFQTCINRCPAWIRRHAMLETLYWNTPQEANQLIHKKGTRCPYLAAECRQKAVCEPSWLQGAPREKNTGSLQNREKPSRTAPIHSAFS